VILKSEDQEFVIPVEMGSSDALWLRLALGKHRTSSRITRSLSMRHFFGKNSQKIFRKTLKLTILFRFSNLASIVYNALAQAR
jgi:hypothetical protein